MNEFVFQGNSGGERMSKKSFLIYTLFIGFFFSSAIASQFLYGEKIKIKTENGVTVIYNPKNPAPPKATPIELILKEDLFIGVKEGNEEYMFLEAVGLDVDDEGKIYVLDRKASHIKVYDKNGKFLRTISKKGQGPGELQGPRDIQITPKKEILVNDMSTRRLIFFNLDGQFLREITAGKMWLLVDPKSDTDGNIVAAFTVLAESPSEQLKKFNSIDIFAKSV